MANTAPARILVSLALLAMAILAGATWARNRHPRFEILEGTGPFRVEQVWLTFGTDHRHGYPDNLRVLANRAAARLGLRRIFDAGLLRATSGAPTTGIWLRWKTGAGRSPRGSGVSCVIDRDQVPMPGAGARDPARGEGMQMWVFEGRPEDLRGRELVFETLEGSSKVRFR